MLYDQGVMPVDLNKINQTRARLLERQAQANGGVAAYLLGLLYENGKIEGASDETAISHATKWYEVAAKGGNSLAQAALAYLIFNNGTLLGLTSDQVLVKAVELNKAAADQGNFVAQYNLANIYLSEPVPDVSPEEAARLAKELLRAAAEQGFEPAKQALIDLEK